MGNSMSFTLSEARLLLPFRIYIDFHVCSFLIVNYDVYLQNHLLSKALCTDYFIEFT